MPPTHPGGHPGRRLQGSLDTKPPPNPKGWVRSEDGGRGAEREARQIQERVPALSDV